jgi:hypothetical protein
MNTVVGFYNLPTKYISVAATAFQVFTVPAAGLGSGVSYPGLPSPALPTGSAISIGLSDIVGSAAYDTHAFKIKVAGTALGIATSTLTLTLDQITAANVGQIGAAAPVTVLGVEGTGLNAVSTLFSTLTLGALSVKFYCEIFGLWDSTSQRSSYSRWCVSALSNAGLLPSPPVYAVGTSSAVTAITDLNFMLSASINTAADSTTYVKISEFSIERC